MSRGMDAELYAATSAAAEQQLADYAAAAGKLAQEQVEVRSKDRRVRVRAAAGGQVVALHLSEDCLTRYSVTALAAIVTRTVMEAQQRAAQAFQREVTELKMPAVTEATRIVQDLIAEGQQ